MQILVTNGGPHPPEKWADVTTSQIMTLIEIAPSADRSFAKAKRDFEYKLFGLLTEIHDEVQKSEQGKLAKDSAHLHSSLAPQQAATEASNKIVEAAKGTMFAEHFQKNEVRAFVYQTLCQHFADVMHIERLWHSDRAKQKG